MKNLQTNSKQDLGRLLDRSEAARLQEVVEAWKGSGYLYGLKGRDLGRMAILAENQKRQILAENNTTADMAVFDTIAIPMIRRQNALMVTPNLISVQPLSYPNGVVFYLDYHVSTTKNPIKAGWTDTNGIDENGQPLNGNNFETRSGYDRHYNNQGYDNTKGRAIPRGYSAAGVAVAGETNAALTALTKAGVDLGTGAGVTAVAVIDFDMAAAGIDYTMDNVASTQVFIPGLVQNVDYFVQRSIQNWTDSALSTGRTAINRTTAGDANGQNQGPASTNNGITGPGTPNKVLRLKIVPATDNIGTKQVYVGFKQYLNLELNPSFSSELSLKIVSSPIQTYIHKMKTAWTVELAQDLMAYHAIDAEAELTQLMAEEVAAEKDRMIIKELITLAAHMEIWNADFANAIDPNPANTVFRGTEGAYNQTLVYAINRANGKIQKSTRKGGANWILISAEGAAKFANLDTFKPTDINDEGTKFAAGVERIGTLNQKWTIYVDPQLPAEICLLGRKGTSFFDTGYVYCPYIEYMLSPVVLDPQEFNPRRQIASRFGTAMLNNKFYAVVYMKDIKQFNVFQEDTTV